MRLTKKIAFSLFILAVMANQAKADIITIITSGLIATATPGFNGTGLSVGDSFSAKWVIDDEAPDFVPLPSFGGYFALQSANFTSGTFSINADLTANPGFVSVNGLVSADVGVNDPGVAVSGEPNTFSFTNFSASFSDPNSPNNLINDRLDDNLERLENGELEPENTFVGFQNAEFLSLNTFNTTVNRTITSVPEPGSFALVALAGGGMSAAASMARVGPFGRRREDKASGDCAVLELWLAELRNDGRSSKAA